MTDLMTRWTESHERLEAAKAALDEACRAKHPIRQQVTRAEEAYRAAVAQHAAILVEQNAQMEAAFAAEEASAVAAAMAILQGA